ncbi:helix-turn-helix domain-containing protein [Maridesulfovibrio bastinii]|uniref:helix-turn-helix domain-containing protein n=1 Tax=Maridesulfovibrio bastinii TaxID=47157 RepID=UPI000408A34C|nr:helix-turn-helix transcriptional regulator [Maridesulfovibrio bastinii]
MQEHTKKPHTDETLFYVSCPTDKAQKAKHFLATLGCHITDDIDAKDIFPDRDPGTLLAGARYREDLTQTQLSEASGIPRRHISEMENGKRPIGKNNAKKIAAALNIDYRILL